MTSVSIVIPTFRRPHALKLTLQALTALERRDERTEVVVVDDAADDATDGVVAPFRTSLPITLLALDHRGAASARNAGARVAEGDVLLFLDDDMIVAPTHLEQHLATHSAYPNAMVGSLRWYTASALAALESTPFGRYRVALERRFFDELDERSLEGDCTEASILAANDLSVARTVFWDLGGFDEAFPHAGAEDQDLSLRARRAGMLLVRNRAIRPEHEEDIVTLERFAWREERGAETAVVLGRRFPEAVGRFDENAPASAADRPRLAAKKTLKAALGIRPALASLHLLASVAERLPLPEGLVRRLYTAIIAVHIQKGYRRALVTRV